MSTLEKNNISANHSQLNETENIHDLTESGLQGHMSELSKENLSGSIEKVNDTNDSDSNFISDISINNNQNQNQNSNLDNKLEIPNFKLLNENTMICNGKKCNIDQFMEYCAKINFSNNGIYNMCKMCGKELNKYFCQSCYKNICEKCSQKSCDKNNKLHELKNLETEKKQADENIYKINKIIEQYYQYIITSQNEKIDENNSINNEQIVKDAKDYDESKFNINESKKEQNINDENDDFINNDIEFAKLIIAQHYYNQFFFNIIKGFLVYFENRYKDIVYKNCYNLTIREKEKGKGVKEEFDPTFINNSKNYITIVTNNNNRSEPLYKFESDNEYIDILVYLNQAINNTISFYKFLPKMIEEKYAYRFDLTYVLNRFKIDIALFSLYGIFPEIFKENDILKEGDALKNGKGEAYYANKTIIYEGGFKNGKRHGDGKLYNTLNKIKYQGNWVDNKAEGEGKLTLEEGKNEYSYDGQWKNNAANGKGKIILFGKQYYTGDFVKGKMEGKGKIKFEYTNADGSYYEYVHYEGNLENCFWHGKGKRYYKDGSIMYDGEWKNGRRNGLGIFYYENGECYDGEFKNDLPDGKGNWYYPGYPNEKHIKYSGYFKEGEYIGNQKYDEDYNCLIF